MSKFKTGDWVRHPKHGIGYVCRVYGDLSLSLCFFNGKGYGMLDTDDSGIEEEIHSIKRAKPNFVDFDSLFTEVEEIPQFKGGDKVKTNRILYYENVEIKKNVTLTVREIYNKDDIAGSYIVAIYENDFLSIDVEIYLSDIELYEGDEK